MIPDNISISPKPLNIIYTSYNEAVELSKRIKEIDSEARVKIHIFETVCLRDWDLLIKNQLKSYDIFLYKVNPKPWAELHWAKVKNYNIHENFLFLCADEQIKLSKEDVEKILKCESARFPRRNFVGSKYFKGSGLGENQDFQYRFFRKLELVSNNLKVHQNPFVTSKTISLDDILIEHFSYNDIFDVINRFNKYTNDESSKLKKEVSVIYAIYAGIKHFIRRYLFQRGYLDGHLGFVFCLLMGLYYPVSHLKYLETKNFLQKEKLK